jgi:hypothetical protein
MKKINISLTKKNLTDLMLGKKLQWGNISIALQDIGFQQMQKAFEEAFNKYHDITNQVSQELNPEDN